VHVVNGGDQSVEVADKLVLDLRAPDEQSDGAILGPSRVRALFAEQDKFVTEWSYYPGVDEAAGNSLRSWRQKSQ
jgi:hypothetical protein